MKPKPKSRTLSQPSLPALPKKPTITNAPNPHPQKNPNQSRNKQLSKSGIYQKKIINNSHSNSTMNNKGEDKQNIEYINTLSPENKLVGKNYRPQIRRAGKLELSCNTVSIVVNQSNINVNNSYTNSYQKKEELLESLLYGDVDVSHISKLNHKEDEDSDQLLIETYEQKNYQPFKNYKNLSPIKSISQYSVTQNQPRLLIIQKTQPNPKISLSTSNTLLKISCNPPSAHPTLPSILYTRLLLHFHQHPEQILKFYCAIYKSITKKELVIKIREYLFHNSIIFNKSQLGQFMEQIYLVMRDVRVGEQLEFEELCQEKFWGMIQRVFLRVNEKNTNVSENLWLGDDVLDGLFFDKQSNSFWCLVEQICSQTPQQIQASFRQSRFCISMDSSQYIPENSTKRKKQIIQTLAKWISNFLAPIVSPPKLQQSKREVNMEETKINMFSPL